MAPLSLPGLSLGENRLLYTDESADRAVVLTHSWNERDDLIPPAAPRLTEPINGEPVAGTQPVFCWDPVPDAVDYQFELCPSDDMRYALSPVLKSSSPTRLLLDKRAGLRPKTDSSTRRIPTSGACGRAAKKAYGGPGANPHLSHLPHRAFHSTSSCIPTGRRGTSGSDGVPTLQGSAPRALYRLRQRRARFQRARRRTRVYSAGATSAWKCGREIALRRRTRRSYRSWVQSVRWPIRATTASSL